LGSKTTNGLAGETFVSCGLMKNWDLRQLVGCRGKDPEVVV